MAWTALAKRLTRMARPGTEPDDRIRARYDRLRKVGRNLNDRLAQRLSKRSFDEGARKLGMLHGNVLVLDTEDELAILQDYCIYDVREGGRTSYERYLAENPPRPDSDEMAVLQAMKENVYSVFMIESAERGLGVQVRNLLSQEEFLLVDYGLSHTAEPRLVLAARVLFFDDLAYSTGATLPLGFVTPEDEAELVDGLTRGGSIEAEGFADPAPLIRQALRHGASSRIVYGEPEFNATGRRIRDFPAPGGMFVPRDSARLDRLALPAPRARSQSWREGKVLRNDPCPCGSGRKYRHCCRQNDLAET
ncbi:MAG: SEC-C metal-binding domain-containing protein [Planctomycetaceae bacterium]